jgi:ABC-type multidrug transport system permease subunit
MTRGRMMAYARYQVLDFLVQRAALPTIVIGAFGLLTWYASRGQGGMAGDGAAAFATAQFRTFGSLFVALAGFIGIGRIVSEDRAGGTVRFLFSKPMSHPGYYVQQWILNGLTLTALAGLLGAAWQAATVPQHVGGLMLTMAMAWVLLGGIGFLLSALTNADLVAIVGVYVATGLLRALRDLPESPLPGWVSQLVRVLPPTQKLDDVREHLLAGAGMPWAHAAHVLLYGVAAFALGLVVLRRTSLVR